MLRICSVGVRQIQTSCIFKSVEVKMPALSPTMTSGTLVKWLKREGDALAPGDILCEVQTDKAVVGVETDDDGVLAKIVVPENTSDVQIGKLIAVIADSDEDWQSVNRAAPSEALSETSQKETTSANKKELDSSGRHSQLVGPATRLLLEKYHIKAMDVDHTGPYGTLLKSDVLKHVDKGNLSVSATPTPKEKTIQPPMSAVKVPPPLAVSAPVSIDYASTSEAGFTDIPLTNMRKTIAKRLSLSKQSIPHAYSTVDMDISAVLSARERLKKEGIKVSVNDFIIKASAAALLEVPEVNVQFAGEDEVRRLDSTDISVAVATEAGLITPIVHAAHTLGVIEISETVKALVEKARENKLQLHEFQGGSFTVSNLGMFGISDFTAIINPPQAAILAIGGAEDVLTADFKAVPRMCVTLCFDARLVSEDSACRFLEAFSSYMEDPLRIVLGRSPKLTDSAQVEMFNF